MSEQNWYETDAMRTIQEKFDEVATDLVDQARSEGHALPYEIEFYDDRRGINPLTTFTMEEDRGNWNWTPTGKSGQIQNPVTATLRWAGSGNLRIEETFSVDLPVLPLSPAEQKVVNADAIIRKVSEEKGVTFVGYALGEGSILLEAVFELQLAYLHPFAVAVGDISSEEDLEQYFEDAEEIFNLKERTPVQPLGTVESGDPKDLAQHIYPTLQDVPKVRVAGGPVH